MRKALFITSLVLLSVSVFSFIAERYGKTEMESVASSAVEEVLASQNHYVVERVEALFAKSSRDAMAVYSRWKKKPKMRSYSIDTSLAESDSPKWIYVGGRRVRSPEAPEHPRLEDALEAHLNSTQKIALHLDNGKYYLFIRGDADDQSYVAAYEPSSFFSSLRSTDGARFWLVLKDGSVIFHSQPRFVGSNASNLKPVAAGVQALSQGSSAIFTQNYLGLEGKDALGSWTPVPALGVLVGTEWPKGPVKLSESAFWFWFAIISGFSGAFLLAKSFNVAGASIEEKQKLFDTSRLDDDAIDYLETARGETQKAIELAREQERIAEKAKRDRGAVMNKLRYYDWKLGLLEEFQEKILGSNTPKQVWTDLGKLFAEKMPGITSVVYRYSISTFSLVPESVFSSHELPENALAYLADARIFIGKQQLMQQLVQTEAFSRWNKSRERHMPLHQTAFHPFPYELSPNTKGLLLVMFDQNMNLEGELDEALTLINALVEKTTSFCDTHNRLLQSMYAKGIAGSSLASAPNHTRSGSRPT